MMLTLFRHLPTQNNLSNIFIGQEDLKCDMRYIELHKEEIQRIKDDLPSFDAFFSSPLQRAYYSARLMLEDNEIIIDDRLIERDLGEWSNVSKDLLRVRFPDAFYDNGRLKFDFTPNGGESFYHLIERVSNFLIDIYNQYKDGSVGVMTHNGVITTVKCLLESNTTDTRDLSFQPYLQPYIIHVEEQMISNLYNWEELYNKHLNSDN